MKITLLDIIDLVSSREAFSLSNICIKISQSQHKTQIYSLSLYLWCPSNKELMQPGWRHLTRGKFYQKGLWCENISYTCVLYTKLSLSCSLQGRGENKAEQNDVSWNQSLFAWWKRPNAAEVWSSPGANCCFLKAAQTSRGKMKEEGNVRGGGGIIIWLHYLVDATRWKPSWQWKLNITTSFSFLAGNSPWQISRCLQYR